MRAFNAIAVAIVKGFVRDKMSMFFAVVFPLMFLVLFGGVFNYSTSKIDMIEVGHAAFFNQLSPGAEQAFRDTFKVTHDDLAGAVSTVRKGDADVAVEMKGNTLVAHYTQTDQVKAATTQGTLSAFVDGANQDASGTPPRYVLHTERVEDKSLKTIQFVTPGLLGWAVAMSAAFGAAATLQGWRNSKLLRRLQLSPVPAGSVVAARVVVTVAIALVQMIIFIGLGMLAFGLQLTGSWWMAVPLLISGTLAFMSLGLLAGSLAKTQEGAVNLANFFVLPMAFLSGSFFPLDGSPTWLQYTSEALPLRHLNDGMLDVMVRGQGPGAALVPIGILLGFAIVVTAISVRLFRWEGD
jgi:ABC-2 type transport system permease protein